MVGQRPLAGAPICGVGCVVVVVVVVVGAAVVVVVGAVAAAAGWSVAELVPDWDAVAGAGDPAPEVAAAGTTFFGWVGVPAEDPVRARAPITEAAITAMAAAVNRTPRFPTCSILRTGGRNDTHRAHLRRACGVRRTP